ncbi:hypothetical protein BS333_19960 [Vibrio azureus]|uniref:hypothetical protein n=2 Tax=Vibrio azureus TaxID=512649 RepID=UPI000519690B|nr:hypothetical protein [Vibrio azureus]AUI88581.1 hypothetical protein BS333_19960 [Vibrio azureus]
MRLKISLLIVILFSFKANSKSLHLEHEHSYTYYSQVNKDYHKALYLFQLVMSRKCLNYKYDDKDCNFYLNEKEMEVWSDWYQENNPDKKQYLDVKLKMLQDTSDVITAIRYGETEKVSPIILDIQTMFDNFFNLRISEIIASELEENNGRTGVNYQPAYEQLLEEYTNKVARYRIDVLEAIEIAGESLKKGEKIQYQELLFALEYLDKKVLQTSVQKNFDNYLKSIFRDLTGCVECATSVIVELERPAGNIYHELSITEMLFFGFSAFGPAKKIEVLYPDEYYLRDNEGTSVVEFLYFLNQYIQQNQNNLLVSIDKLMLDTKPDTIDIDSWRMMKDGVDKFYLGGSIWNKSMIPNIRRLFNSLVNITTDATGATLSNTASIAMNRAVTSQFKISNIGKTFNVASALDTVVKHIPKVVVGESIRYLCNSDSIEGSGFTNGLSLEEICVYVPSFRAESFPITISSQLDGNLSSSEFHGKVLGDMLRAIYLSSLTNSWEVLIDKIKSYLDDDFSFYGQDDVGYRVFLVHDSGVIVFRSVVFAKQQIILKKKMLLGENINNYTLKVFSNVDDTNVATLKLKSSMFNENMAGVIKGKRFYFVEKIDDHSKPEHINLTRANKVCGLPPYHYKNRREYYYRCLEDKYFPRGVPDYFLANMSILGLSEREE